MLAGGLKDEVVSFTAQVSEGQSLTRALGHGLVFRLATVGLDNHQFSGWQIAINPEGNSTDNYAVPVNPPYRAYNVLHLHPGWGMDAKEIIAQETRVFNFLLDDESYQAAMLELSQALWQSEGDPEKALRQLFKHPMGVGKVTIVTATLAEDKEKDEYIKSLEVRVDVKFHGRALNR